MKKHRILIVDDDKNIRFAFKKTFEQEDYIVISAQNGGEALKLIRSQKPDLIFTDITMPGLNGLDLLEKLKTDKVAIPVIVITGFGTMQTAIKAIQLGAYEYILKPLDVDKITVVAHRALEMVNLKNEVKNLRSQLSTTPNENEIIGRHPLMQEVYKKIGAISTTPNLTNVLITGDSGTGKELVANAIHKNGANAKKPFIAINCSVLPENLLESELFGHEKGAFTDAKERKIGKFEAAGEGTIFLDEIGEMTANLQRKLLRVLQEREFYRVGGNKLISVKARFVTATNLDLKSVLREGSFRKDLYYRLNVMYIHLPPLNKRREDIPLLFDHFIRKYSRRLGKTISVIAPEIIDKINNYDYPGNVRELENIIERAMVMSQGGVLHSMNLPDDKINNGKSDDINIPTLVLEDARKIFSESFEEKYISELLKASNGIVNDAAKKAKVNIRTIQRLAKRYNIKPNSFKKK